MSFLTVQALHGISQLEEVIRKLAGDLILSHMAVKTKDGTHLC